MGYNYKNNITIYFLLSGYVLLALEISANPIESECPIKLELYRKEDYSFYYKCIPGNSDEKGQIKSKIQNCKDDEDDYCYNLSKQGNYINCVNDLKPKRVYEDIAFLNQTDRLNPQLITCSMGSLTLEVPIFFTFTGTQKIHYMWTNEIDYEDFISLTIIDTTVQHYTENKLYLIQCQILKFPFLSSGTMLVEDEEGPLTDEFNSTLLDRPFTLSYITTDYELTLTGRVNFQCYAELKILDQIASVRKEIYVNDISDSDIRRIPLIRLLPENLGPDGYDGETLDFLDEPFELFCEGYAPTEIIQSHPNLPWLKERSILTSNHHLYENWNVTYTSTFSFDHKTKEIVLDTLICKYINETIMMAAKFQYNDSSKPPKLYLVRNSISYFPTNPKTCSYPITHVKSRNDSYFKCGNGFPNVTGRLYPCETMNSCQNLFRKQQENSCIKISNTIDSRGYNILTTSFDDSPLRTGQYVCEGPSDKLGAIQIYFGGDEDKGERRLSTRFNDFGAEDLMFIILNKEKYFINDTLSGSCKVYRVYFAEYPSISIFEGDSQISQEKVDLDLTSQTTKEEYWVRDFSLKVNNNIQSYSIGCSGVLWNANDPISVSKFIVVRERIPLSFINETEHKEFYDTDTNIELKCGPIGDPVSEIIWTSRHLQEIQGNGNVFVISRGSSAFEEYTCTASNEYYESVNKTFHIHIINSGRRNIIIGIIAGFVILGILVLTIYLVMRRRIIRLRRAIMFLTNKEIDEFWHGKPDQNKNDDEFVLIDSIAYNNVYEVQRDHIVFDKNKLLGSGQYGVVMKGKLWSHGEVVEVAVKSVKEEATIEYFKALMAELKILAYIGKHDCIASLIAASSAEIKKRELYVCIELCMTSLLSYIKQDNYEYVDIYGLGEIENIEDLMLDHSYQNTGKVVSTKELLRWSMEIAAAMDFLGMKKVVHGDLAARNILLTEDLKVKVCDFGLARQLVDYTYIKSADCPLPWKWMAIESLSRKEFSPHSDIWAFGITVWEMFTLGEEPYGGARWTFDFVDQLRAGLRPSKPKFASIDLYKVMLETWKENPKERISFADLKHFFESELMHYEPNFHRNYVNV